MSTTETIELLKATLGKKGGLAKGFTQSNSATTGLTAYDLEAPAKTLYPVITPLRNALPRVSGAGGIQANWRAVTGINTGNVSAGVSEGNRGGTISTSVKEYLAAYKGIGLEDFVTYEAQYAGQGFEDVKARSVSGLLRATMIQEEKILLGGNTSINLGTTPTPTVANSGTGGSIAAATYNVIAVALSFEGRANSSLANGVPALITRNNADGSVDTYGGGSAQKSAASPTTTTGSTSSVTAVVTPVVGALAYAWYFGVAGSERLAAITTINSVKLTSVPTTTQLASALPSSDNSSNRLVFDGFLSLAFAPGSNAYVRYLASGTPGVGTPLTAGTDGTIEEIDAALLHFWENWKISPTTIWVSSQEMGTIRKKVLTGSTAASQRFSFTSNQNGLMGGTVVNGYINPFTMGEAEHLPIKIHPDLPAGTILFTTDTLPYPLSGVSNLAQVRCRQDYYSLEFPMRTRKYEYGVYADEVLQHYAPFSLGVVTNIAAG